MTQPIAYLRDNFEDNSQATAWANSYANGSATKSEAGGQARFALPSSTAGSHGAAYQTDGTYDLTGGAGFINVVQMVATGVAAQAFFDLILDSNNRLRWIQESNTLKAQTIVAGVTTDRYSATWNATTYKYWRFSEGSGTVFFETSTNGTSWTTRASLTAPFAVTALTIQFGASCGNVASPGAFHVEEFNPILPALTTNWRWVRAEWPLTHRFRNVTLAIDAAGTAQGYLAIFSGVDVSGNPVSPAYYSGPLDKNGNLTAQATQAAAQAMAVNLPLDGRWSLPAMVEARFVQLYARSIDGNSFVLREAYGRRLVQTDDLEAESVKTHVIAAGAVTADKIFVTSLSAITANIGQLTITDPNGNPAWIYQGSGTGDSPTTGLKIFNSGGIGKLSTYNSSVEQVTLDTDGKLKAGAGAVSLDADGLELTTQLSYANKGAVRWKENSGSNRNGYIAMLQDSTYNTLYVRGERVGTRVGQIDIAAGNTSNATATRILMDSLVPGNGIQFYTNATKRLEIQHDGVIALTNVANITGPINLGSASAAASSGQLAVQYDDSSTTSVPTVLYVEHNSSGTPATGFGVDLRWRLKSSTTANQEAGLIRAEWVTATHASRTARLTLYAYATGAQEGIRIEAGAAPKIGVLGAAAQAKQTITGTRTGTLAQLQTVVANMLTAIAGFGFWTDSTT